jgi:DNA-binding IclR family transcriptional regulator
MTGNHDPRSGWNRLEDSLLTIKPGEEISVDTLVAETGLARATVERVLEELTHTELFERKGANVFVRRSLWETGAADMRSQSGSSPPATAASHPGRFSRM